MEDPELDDEFDEDDEQEDLDFLSEPSTSLSIGHDTLHHLMPPPFVPTLCMRLLRLESRENNNSSDPPWSVRSTRPPPQPHNHGFHTDEVLLPANRPENFIDPNHIFFKTQPPTQPIQRQPVQPIQPTQPTRPQQPQRIIHTHRHVRPSTTDPGTLTARHANPNVPSTHNIARQRPSSTSATHRKRPTRKTKPKTKPLRPPSSTGTVFGAGSPNASSSHLSSTSSSYISPRLVEISKSPKVQQKVFGPKHAIRYSGKPPRLAYYNRDDHPHEHPSVRQHLPDRKDHPENPENTPTVQMHRPQQLATMRGKRQLHLEQAAKRGEIHAVLQLEKQKILRKAQRIREKKKRAFRRCLLMAKLDRFATGGATVIRNRAKDGSGGVRMNAKMLKVKQEKRLGKRSFVYKEWDDYREPHELEHTDTVVGTNSDILRKAMDEHDQYVEEHAVLWTPRTAKAVLAEERLVKDLLKNCKFVCGGTGWRDMACIELTIVVVFVVFLGFFWILMFI